MIHKRIYNLHVALVYPNQYHIGNSSLAPRVVYDLLNSIEGLYCERIFQPEVEGLPPSSIETGTPLRNFKHILVTIQFELDYVNLCKMLESSGIPFLRQERENKEIPHIVVLGGPVPTANPWLACAIADAVFLGEIEPIYKALSESFLQSSRSAILHFLSQVPGFWIPSTNHHPSRIVRTTRFHTPLSQVIPLNTSQLRRGTYSDHFLMQASRGCSRGCAFCLIGHTMRPARHAQTSDLMKIATEGMVTTGARRMSLIGSSIADHPDLCDLLHGLNISGIPFSLPSLRIDSDQRIIEEVVKTGQKTITIAPESHIEEERLSLGKNISNDMIFNYSCLLTEAGIRELRAYFITGLPETDTRSRSSMDQWKSEMEIFVSEMKRSFQKGVIRFSLTPFVPKPHTLFQNSVPDFERMKKEQDSCIPIFRRHRIRFSLGSLRWAPVQAFLSLADGSAAVAIRKVCSKGGHLNVWKKTVGDFKSLLEKESEAWEDRFSIHYSTEWL